jgi:hypothetical protein
VNRTKCINRLFGKEKEFLWKRKEISLEKKRSFFGKEKEFLWKRKGVSLEKKRSFFGKEKKFLWKIKGVYLEKNPRRDYIYLSISEI